MTPERRVYPLELFRLEVVRGDYFRRDGLGAPNKTAAQVGEKAGRMRAMGSSRRCAPGATGFSEGGECSDSLHSFICFALTNDFVNDARDRPGGVD